MNKISLFGKGFVGGEFYRQFKGEITAQDRHDYVPKTHNIVSFISTVDNYNVQTDPYLDVKTNITTLINILENARLRFGKDVVFNYISTWFVYGDTMLPASEDSVCNPKGFYSITKYAAENLLRSYCETFEMQFRILRLANVLGKDDVKVSMKKNYTQQLIKLLLNNEDVHLYYEGNFFRDFIDVRDCAKAIKLVMDVGNTGEIYNISNGIPIRFSDVVKFLQKETDSRSEIKNIHSIPFHQSVQTRSMYLNNSKLKKLGYTPKFTVFQSLQEIVDAYRAQS